MLYTSDYGYSDRLSQTLAKGITKAGVKTEMVDVLSVDPQVGGGWHTGASGNRTTAWGAPRGTKEHKKRQSCMDLSALPECIEREMRLV